MNMKKVSLGLVALLAVLSVKVNARDSGYGIKAHGGTAMVTNAKKFLKEDKAGMFNSLSLSYGLGIYADCYFKDIFGVRFESLYNYAAINYRSENSETSIGAGYLKIPFLAKIYPMGADTDFSILVGPEIGFPIAMKSYARKVKTADSGFKELGDDSYKAYKQKVEEKYFNKLAIGANVGLEYELPKFGVNFNLAYVMDFSTLFNIDGTGEKGVKAEDNAMLQNIRLSVGYNIAAALA
jgi:hypothetical protein